MKSIAYRMLCVLAVFSVLGLLVKALSTGIVLNSTEQKGKKPYTISVIDSDSPAYKIGALILRPIIEARIDRYISEQGLEKYLRDVASAAPLRENFRLLDIEEGEGREVLCGQSVSAMVFHFPMEDEEMADPLQAARKIGGNIRPISFKLGSHEIGELNYALTGMRHNGSRVVTVTSGRNSGSYYVQLTSVDDEVPEARSIRNLMLFDKEDPNYGGGTVAVARCGDKVSVTYTVKDVRGEVLVQDRVVDFTIGSRSVPIVLELGIIGLRSDNRRSIIVPPELLSDFDGSVDKHGVKIIDAQVTHKAPATGN
ncbi:FKBP-type peptidyl-prolyl cis-trans isomerase [Anaplasma capra]|uniref:FKBP-type peptidyl-prolyl cis-trans isomerase n=1 Tax=Anaplasma capra TaxID=1562740 RepID=UPI0021D5C443|nr:FKBP-type peptidyl-prolyl cis-trans isomerase [Anaplasma capra]